MNYLYKIFIRPVVPCSLSMRKVQNAVSISVR